MMIKRVLISLSDKSNIIEFAAELSKFGVEFLSTGGTAKLLRDNGFQVTDVSEYTKFPEMLDGRVKTLHPKVHGALLGLRNNHEHKATMAEHGIIPIDMLVINLYPFKKTIESPDCKFKDAIENIDIGGPAMIRSASKNFESVTVLTDPADYAGVIDEMKDSNGEVSYNTNFRLAIKAYQLTHNYDGMIYEYLNDKYSKQI